MTQTPPVKAVRSRRFGPALPVILAAWLVVAATAIAPPPRTRAADGACVPTRTGSGVHVAWTFQQGIDPCAPASPGFQPRLFSIVAGGPGFVATAQVADGSWTSFTSVDGAHWTEHPLPLLGWTTQAYSPTFVGSTLAAQPILARRGDTIVAIGSFAAATTTDGVHWTLGPRRPHQANAWPTAVTGDGPRWVALGNARIGRTGWTSTDGRTWREIPRQAAFADICAVTSIAYGRAGYVAVGQGCFPRRAAVLTSRDGISWRRAPNQTAFTRPSSLASVIRGGPGYVATGDYQTSVVIPGHSTRGAAFWTSADGRTWRRVAFFRDDLPRPLHAKVVVRVTGGYLGLGQTDPWTIRYRDAPTAWFSADGTHWARDGHLPDDPALRETYGFASLDSAAAVGRHVVAIGSFRDPATPEWTTGNLVWNGVIRR